MSRTNIRVELPTSSPDAMLKNSDGAIKKHKALGAESPLHHFNMVKFEETFLAAGALLEQGRQQNSQAEADIENAYQLIGNAKGQTIRTEGTLYYTIDIIRKELLNFYDGNDERLEEWGFNIVISKTKGRTNVRVDIPISSSDKMLRLCEKIYRKHISFIPPPAAAGAPAAAAAPASPLHHLDMEAFNEKCREAKRMLEKGRALHETAQGNIQDAWQKIGIDDDQTSRTKGTLYNTLDKIRTALLAHYKGREEQLEQWGFTVVITETVPGRKTKRIEVIIPKGTSTVVKNVINGSSATNSGKAPLALWEGEGPMPGNPTEIDKGNSWKVIAPSGILSIKNLSSKLSGRCKLTVSK